MVIRNGKVFIGGKFYPYDIHIENGLISRAGEKAGGGGEEIDAAGKFVFPGFVETHIHGGARGYLDDGEEQVRKIAAVLPRQGVTSWIPTPHGRDPKTYPGECVKTIRGIRAAKGASGADILGINLYMPYRYCPSTPGMPMIQPSKEHTLALMDGDLSDLKIAGVAPGLPGAMEWIKWITGQGVVAMIGFTEGTTEQMYEAADNGATLTDHFFNGFPFLNHYEGGSTIGCLLEKRLYHQLTCDLVHVSKPFVELLMRVKGVDHILAVSDGSCFVDAPDGEYTHRGGSSSAWVKVIKKGGAVRNMENGQLVTGSHPYDENMRTFYTNGFKLEDIGLMFSENAAKFFGLTDRGKIEAGRRADLVIMDQNLNVEKTLILGKVAYSK